MSDRRAAASGLVITVALIPPLKYNPAPGVRPVRGFSSETGRAMREHIYTYLVLRNDCISTYLYSEGS